MGLEFLALDIPGDWLAGTIAATAAAVAAGIKVLWGYFQKREQERIDTYQKVIADKDSLIAQKDEKIEELGKSLSKKSDAHAEELKAMGEAMMNQARQTHKESMAHQERVFKIMGDFTRAVEKMGVDMEDGA